MNVEILLKQVRQNKNITLNRLSERSGISTTHINDIENNIKSPSLLIMIRLAKALDVEITELYKVKW
ncbi:MAG: helix-turn-helix transcriptional regulator [Clostridia bacterium]|nr:helix-turn-helix transcriptional regulator [Clostridia bacterium]